MICRPWQPSIPITNHILVLAPTCSEINPFHDICCWWQVANGLNQYRRYQLFIERLVTEVICIDEVHTKAGQLSDDSFQSGPQFIISQTCSWLHCDSNLCELLQIRCHGCVFKVMDESPVHAIDAITSGRSVCYKQIDCDISVLAFRCKERNVFKLFVGHRCETFLGCC